RQVTMNNKMYNITEKINLLDKKNITEDIDNDNEDTIVDKDDNIYEYQEDYDKNNDSVKKLF
ncbi:4716_t:CDS:1, partial [Funneliformis caledonium]